MGSNNKLKKIRVVDAWEVNQESIVKVAEDWNYELYRKGRGVYATYCPNPNHKDSHLGNCVITDDGVKNCFHCFACGAGGGPIDFVMLVDNCDFIAAKNKLAQKYGKVKIEYVDESTLPPKWTGLSTEEYNMFGLKNTTIQIPYDETENGETLYHYDRYTLRDLARDDPEFHDAMLIGKFAEKVDAVATFMALLDCGYFIQYGDGFEFCYDKQWEDACIKVVKRHCILLKKGLMDKSKLSMVFSTMPDFLKNDQATDSEDLYEPEEEIDPKSKELKAKVRERVKSILISEKQKSVSNL